LRTTSSQTSSISARGWGSIETMRVGSAKCLMAERANFVEVPEPICRVEQGVDGREEGGRLLPVRVLEDRDAVRRLRGGGRREILEGHLLQRDLRGSAGEALQAGNARERRPQETAHDGRRSHHDVGGEGENRTLDLGIMRPAAAPCGAFAR
jgi:hypothetical protein